MLIEGFDWDDGNRAKIETHGVTMSEVEAMFANTPRVAPDPVHSASETRYLAIGTTDAERHVFVAFTLRPAGSGLRIRPISARYMHQKEIDAHEKAAARPRH